MFKGKLVLHGGVFGFGEGRRCDHFEYNGVVQRRLEFIVQGESLQEIAEKLRKVLPDVKGIAGPGASERYRQEVAALPMKAAEQLDRTNFAFCLDFDDWEDLIAGASWKVDPFDDSNVIILQ